MNCPNCLGDEVIRTDWKPPDGYDPYLVQYRCEDCHSEWYQNTGKVKNVQAHRQKTFNR